MFPKAHISGHYSSCLTKVLEERSVTLTGDRSESWELGSRELNQARLHQNPQLLPEADPEFEHMT